MSVDVDRPTWIKRLPAELEMSTSWGGAAKEFRASTSTRLDRFTACAHCMWMLALGDLAIHAVFGSLSIRFCGRNGQVPERRGCRDVQSRWSDQRIECRARPGRCLPSDGQRHSSRKAELSRHDRLRRTAEKIVIRGCCLERKGQASERLSLRILEAASKLLNAHAGDRNAPDTSTNGLPTSFFERNECHAKVASFSGWNVYELRMAGRAHVRENRSPIG